MISDLFKKHPHELERLKSGDSKLIGFFVGQVMKLTKGKANPKLVNDIISKSLSE